MNLDACDRLPTRVLGGVWYRAIAPHRLPTPLYVANSQDQPTRYNPGPKADAAPFSTLYLAEDHVLCLHEIEAVFSTRSGLVPNPLRTWCALNIAVGLTRVVDLNLDTNRNLLKTSIAELTGNWRLDPDRQAPTQALAEALFLVPRVEAAVYPSTKTGGHDLVVFPAKLGTSSWVEDMDATGVRHTLP